MTVLRVLTEEEAVSTGLVSGCDTYNQGFALRRADGRYLRAIRPGWTSLRDEAKLFASRVAVSEWVGAHSDVICWRGTNHVLAALRVLHGCSIEWLSR